MKRVIIRTHPLSLAFISFLLLIYACGHKTRQQAGPEESIKNFHLEAHPRQFENVPPNSTVLRLLFIDDSLSVQEVKEGRAELTRFDPVQPDPDVLKGEVSVYNYDVLNALGNILYSGYFRADPRVHTFYPGEGNLKDRVLHDSSVSPSFFVTVCLPLDSLKQFENIRVRKIEYQDGKPVLEISPGKLKDRSPYTTLSLKRK